MLFVIVKARHAIVKKVNSNQVEPVKAAFLHQYVMVDDTLPGHNIYCIFAIQRLADATFINR